MEESLLQFFCDAEEPDLNELTLTRVVGREAISTLYEHVLELYTTIDGGLAPETIDAWLARPSHFSYGEAQVSGVVKELRLLPTRDPQRVTYEAVLVPRLWLTTQTKYSRIYQTKTVIEIVKAILDSYAIPYQDSTQETYPVREYVVQYAESDFDFISRLMEHWGISYHFDQQDDGEVMVIGDAPAAFVVDATFPELVFATREEAVANGGIEELSRTHRPQTASVTVADYNWRTPFIGPDGDQTERQLQLRITQPVDEITGRGQEWRYGEHVKDEVEAAFIARVRGEERMADRVTYAGKMTAPTLCAGRRVTVTGMPLVELDQDYLIVELRTVLSHGGSVAVGCEQEFTAIPHATPYRPPLRAPIPKIHGYMHAVVDGEVHGTAAPIDVLGRYKLLMPYDTTAAPGGGASRWVRMAQPSAGPNYGMHLPLHIGTEVAVIHLDGDPDRPVILSAIPNIDTQSPVVDANATQSRIRTRANILFELEDDA